jgi:hypothetical protein
MYVISLADGFLYVGGRMTVNKIVSRAEAVKILGRSSLYQANEWVIGSKETGTKLNLHRRLAPSLSKRLRFISPDGKTRGLCFVSGDRLDNQATRGLQELTPESAALLEEVLQATDQHGIPDEVVTVGAGEPEGREGCGQAGKEKHGDQRAARRVSEGEFGVESGEWRIQRGGRGLLVMRPMPRPLGPQAQ